MKTASARDSITYQCRGRVVAGAYRGKLLRHPEDASNPWQNLVGAVHERLKADAHRLHSQASTPALRLPFLLAVGLGDIGGFFINCKRLAETLQHGVLAMQDSSMFRSVKRTH